MTKSGLIYTHKIGFQQCFEVYPIRTMQSKLAWSAPIKFMVGNMNEVNEAGIFRAMKGLISFHLTKYSRY